MIIVEFIYAFYLFSVSSFVACLINSDYNLQIAFIEEMIGVTHLRDTLLSIYSLIKILTIPKYGKKNDTSESFGLCFLKIKNVINLQLKTVKLVFPIFKDSPQKF